MSKRYEDLGFTDDFIFCKTLENNPDLARELLELILDIRISGVRLAQSQKSLKFTALDRGVRFDVYVEDEEHSIYDIEMQTTDSPDLAKRARYYQAMIDLDTVEKGEDLRNLRNSYVIFICTRKPHGFSANLPIYTFKTQCQEDHSLILNDKTTKVFVNSQGTFDFVSEKLQHFLLYLRDQQPRDTFTEKLEAMVREIRASKNWRHEYMTLEMKLKEQFFLGKQEGIQEGIAKGQKAGLKEGLRPLYQAIADGALSVAYAAKILDVSEEEVLRNAEAYAKDSMA
jgi:predicted transposase/invertase (TIGR01784 family)